MGPRPGGSRLRSCGPAGRSPARPDFCNRVARALSRYLALAPPFVPEEHFERRRREAVTVLLPAQGRCVADAIEMLAG
jgi:hypothetical protein